MITACLNVDGTITTSKARISFKCFVHTHPCQYFHEQKVTTNVDYKKQAVCNSHRKGFDDVKAWPLSSGNTGKLQASA